MNQADYTFFSKELSHLAGLIEYNNYDEGALNALAVGIDNHLAKVRNIRQRLTLAKCQTMVRDAHLCARDGEDEAASDMLGVAQYWLGKAAP